MARLLSCGALALSLLTPLAADVSGCACDPSKPETLEARECGLCKEAEKQPQNIRFFVLKDTNPRKPNRWLVLPRVHWTGPHALDQMSKKDRDALWAYAIAAARERFGDQWGLAYNGWKVRTQCHLHVHIGQFIPAAESHNFKFVRRPEDFPAPVDGGLLIHPVTGGYRVLTGENAMETGLLR